MAGPLLHLCCTALALTGLGLGAAPAYGQEPEDPTPPASYRATMQAYEQHKYGRYRAGLRRLIGPAEADAPLLYKLAGAETLLGDTTTALRLLQRLADHGAGFSPLTDPDFGALQHSPRLLALQKQLTANLGVISKADLGFRLADPNFIPEGIAYDPDRRQFFVGSIGRHKIAVVRKGRESQFVGEAPAPGRPALGAVLGLNVDAERRRLYACAQEGGGVRHPRTGLWAFDLRKGTCLQIAWVPDTTGGHRLNDLTVAADGTVYVSDSEGGGLWRQAPGAAQLTRWLAADSLAAPNGLALSADDGLLYVAYARGLAVVDTRTGRRQRLTGVDEIDCNRLDGLVRYGPALIGIQNDGAPQRVIRYDLAPDGRSVARFTVLEANRPEFDAEPTTGTVAGDEYYFIVNSHIPDFMDPDAAAARLRLEPPLIMRRPLK